MNPPQVYMRSPSWTLLPPPSPFHPSGPSQCTSPKHPVSFIEPGLATHFIHDILHDVNASYVYCKKSLQSQTLWKYFLICLVEALWRRHWWPTPVLLPGRLQSMGSLRVGHNWATSLSLFTFMRWRRKWQPTPVFLPGESQGEGSLVGCCLWGHTESDTTEVT